MDKQKRKSEYTVLTIQTDTRQQMNRKHHKVKEQWLLDHGIEIVHSKMLIGDYQIPSDGSVVVDTKKDCMELYADLIQDHARFHRECENAQKWGIKLYILVENKHGFRKSEDIVNWKNPLMYKFYMAAKKGIKRKPPASNAQLLKIMHSMSRDYGVEFLFCSTEEAAPMIVKLLGGDEWNSENTN